MPLVRTETLKELPRLLTDIGLRRRFLNRYAISHDCWPLLTRIARLLLRLGIGIEEIDGLFPGWTSVGHLSVSLPKSSPQLPATGIHLPFSDEMGTGWVSLAQVNSVHRYLPTRGEAVESRRYKSGFHADCNCGTALLPWGDEWLAALSQTKTTPGKRPLHRIILLDKKFAVVASSEPFTLPAEAPHSICTDICWDQQKEFLLLANSHHGENSVVLGSLPAGEIRERLHGVPRGILEFPPPEDLRKLRYLNQP